MAASVCGDWTPLLDVEHAARPTAARRARRSRPRCTRCRATAIANAKQRFLGTLDNARGTERAHAVALPRRAVQGQGQRGARQPLHDRRRSSRSIGSRAPRPRTAASRERCWPRSSSPLPAVSITGAGIDAARCRRRRLADGRPARDHRDRRRDRTSRSCRARRSARAASRSTSATIPATLVDADGRSPAALAKLVAGDADRCRSRSSRRSRRRARSTLDRRSPRAGAMVARGRIAGAPTRSARPAALRSPATIRRRRRRAARRPTPTIADGEAVDGRRDPHRDRRRDRRSQSVANALGALAGESQTGRLVAVATP